MAKKNGPLKIEKGIPIPAAIKAFGPGRPRSEFSMLIAKLRPGESLLSHDTGNIVRSRVAALARRIGLVGKFVTRKMPDGVRVWRIK